MSTGIGAPPPVFLNWCDRLQFMLILVSARYRLMDGCIAAVALGHQ